MDTSLKLMSMENGCGREYLYDVDEKLLWVTDYDAAMNCVAKRWFPLDWNPIDHIRRKAQSKGLDIDNDFG